MAAAPAGLELYWVSVYVNGVLAYKGNLAAGDNADFGVDVSGNPGVTVFTARASCYSTRHHRTTRDEDTKTMNPWCDGGGCTNPYADNYDSTKVFDDGSCVTCASAGKCMPYDDDDGANCNGIGNGCCDGYCETAGDCSPSFRQSFTATNGTYYPSCFG